MDSYSRLGDFVIKTPGQLNREFYDSVMLDEYGNMREPALCMRVVPIEDKVFFRGITESEYYYLAGKLYTFGAERGVPAENIVLVTSPRWYGRPASDAPDPDKMQKWIERESSETQREFYVEDENPEPDIFLFDGTKRECVVARTLRGLKYRERGATMSEIKETFFEDEVGDFIRHHLYSSLQLGDKGEVKRGFNPKKKLHINGILSLSSNKSSATEVKFTGSYAKALELFTNVFIDRARYGLGRKRL